MIAPASGPRGYAATAAEFLDEAASDADGAGLAVRQFAATQAIGYALLAITDQLADLTDASTDLAGRVDGITDALDRQADALPAGLWRRLAGLVSARKGGDRR